MFKRKHHINVMRHIYKKLWFCKTKYWFRIRQVQSILKFASKTYSGMLRLMHFLSGGKHISSCLALFMQSQYHTLKVKTIPSKTFYFKSLFLYFGHQRLWNLNIRKLHWLQPRILQLRPARTVLNSFEIN